MRCVRAPHHAALEGEPHCLQQLPVADECEVDRRWLPTRQWRTVFQRQQRGPFFTSRAQRRRIGSHATAWLCCEAALAHGARGKTDVAAGANMRSLCSWRLRHG